MSTTEAATASGEPQPVAGWLETSDGQYAGYYVHEPDDEQDEQDLGTPEPVTDAMVDAALDAVAEYQRGAREAVWASPSRGQVRAMLEGAARAGRERGDEKEAGRG
jgi:acyl-CoA reductase-like NAD-dependent aldehyde dehydrogenase